MIRSRHVRRSPEFPATALRVTGDLVVVVDDTGRITYLSPAAGQILAGQSGSYCGRPLTELVHPDDRELTAAILTSFLSCGPDPPSGPVPIRLTAAGDRWMEMEISRPAGRGLAVESGTVIVLRDVEAQREAERDLGRAARDTAARGASQIVFDHHRPTEASDRQGLAADVERALAAGELELHYQPIHDARSGGLIGFEGLLRWNRGDRGVVTAGEFLPAVGGTAAIVEIGDFVLAEGCAQLARWQRCYGARAPSLSINISARQLRQGGFAHRVGAELKRAGADPRGLCLELLESHALEREPLAMAELARIRAIGVGIALDDFGTGFSSLQHLQRISADVLKIDRAFVRLVGIEEGATAIVRAAIELGQAFGMVTVAEGVTTVEQHRLLLAMGCHRIQGFLIAPALPAELAGAMLASDRAADPATTGEPDQPIAVLRAWGQLALIDTGYRPSDDEVAALAGVRALDARCELIRSLPCA